MAMIVRSNAVLRSDDDGCDDDGCDGAGCAAGNHKHDL